MRKALVDVVARRLPRVPRRVETIKTSDRCSSRLARLREQLAAQPPHTTPQPPRLEPLSFAKAPPQAARQRPLTDAHARTHDYLRVSLTERCSLRCVYCMPEDGISLTRPERLLATDELERLATIFVRAGVTKIRLTGGEPTLRADLVDVVRSIDALRPLGLREISMTTNGIALERKLPELRAAGLDRINISLDTLRRERFVELTRRDGLDKVLSSMRAALDLGFAPLKLNCVVMKGVNDGEVLDFARLTLASDVHVRFIEFMPFDGNRWSADRILPHHELVSRLRDAHGGLERVSNDAHDVARSWRIPGARGTVSTIASMTQPFCAGCNRIRLTADGAFMTCLFGKSEVSLRDALRAGESDDAILVRVWDALQRKHAAHAGMHSIAKATRRPMTTIGG